MQPDQTTLSPSQEYNLNFTDQLKGISALVDKKKEVRENGLDLKCAF